jgi:hypothetical protein
MIRPGAAMLATSPLERNASVQGGPLFQRRAPLFLTLRPEASRNIGYALNRRLLSGGQTQELPRVSECDSENILFCRLDHSKR